MVIKQVDGNLSVACTGPVHNKKINKICEHEYMSLHGGHKKNNNKKKHYPEHHQTSSAKSTTQCHCESI